MENHFPPHLRYFLEDKTVFISKLGPSRLCLTFPGRKNYQAEDPDRLPTQSLKRTVPTACPSPTLPISLCSLYWFSCTQSWGGEGGEGKGKHQVKLNPEAVLIPPQQPVQGPILALGPSIPDPPPPISSSFHVWMGKLGGLYATKKDKRACTLMSANTNGELWLYFTP